MFVCMTDEKQFIKEIKDFRKNNGGMAPTTFGRLCLNNPNFVSDLHAGRSPTLKQVRRTREWMLQYERQKRIENAK